MELNKNNFLVEIEIDNIPTQFEMNTDNILVLIKKISEGENITFFSRVTRKSDGLTYSPNGLCNAFKGLKFYLGSEAIDFFIDKFVNTVGFTDSMEYDLAIFQGFLELQIRNYRGIKSS